MIPARAEAPTATRPQRRGEVREICTTDRDALRAWIPPDYSPIMHVAVLFAGSAAALVFLGVRFASRLHPMDLVALIVTFFFSTFLEYVAHRWVMHRPLGWLRVAWEAHTGRHHYFYRSDAPSWERSRDIWLILFSLSDTVLLSVFVAPPLALLYRVLSPGAWALTVATSIAYFVAYEGLHLAFHVPEGHAVLRLPLIGRLRDRHLRHHDLARPGANFGVTNPLWDWMFGTERAHDTLG